MNKHMDKGSFIVASVTFLLFVAAVFTKGITHDLFLESGVFLVSVKIIMMAYRNSVAVSQLDEKLDAVLERLAQTGGRGGETERGSRDRPDSRS